MQNLPRKYNCHEKFFQPKNENRLKISGAWFIIAMLVALRQKAVSIQKKAPGRGVELMFKIIVRVVVLTIIILLVLSKTAA